VHPCISLLIVYYVPAGSQRAAIVCQLPREYQARKYHDGANGKESGKRFFQRYKFTYPGRSARLLCQLPITPRCCVYCTRVAIFLYPRYAAVLSDSLSRDEQKRGILAGALIGCVADNLPEIIDFLADLQI
jgi:hypothetical protein